VPLGAFPEASYDELTFELAAGDVFVFCTDGVFEAFSPEGEEFGAERLAAVIAEHRQEAAARIVDAIFDAVDAFRNGAVRRDDMTAVVLKVTA
jgi:sigma-B regulation protein RsbU (phosphoserine phosphatase)